MSLKPADLFNLAGKTAVVIGGTGELCGAMAEGLAAAGALAPQTVLTHSSVIGGHSTEVAVLHKTFSATF